MASINFFGQFGEIIKIFIKKNSYHNKADNGTYYSAYINYSDELSACLAILTVQSKNIEGMELLKASYATTNYCKFYVKKMICRTKGCSYFHMKAPKSECIFDINKKSSIAIFDAMLRKAFDAAIYHYQKFETLINFLQIKNGIYYSCLPVPQDALSYLKMVQYCGSKESNDYSNQTPGVFQKDNFKENINEKHNVQNNLMQNCNKNYEKSMFGNILNDSKEQSELIMTQALEDEIPEFKLSKLGNIQQNTNQKMLVGTLFDAESDQNLSNTQNQTQNNTDLDLRYSQEFSNFGNNVSNFDKNCFDGLEMQRQNNNEYQNCYQMYQNCPVQGGGVDQQQSTMQYSTNFDQKPYENQTNWDLQQNYYYNNNFYSDKNAPYQYDTNQMCPNYGNTFDQSYDQMAANVEQRQSFYENEPYWGNYQNNVSNFCSDQQSDVNMNQDSYITNVISNNYEPNQEKSNGITNLKNGSTTPSNYEESTGYHLCSIEQGSDTNRNSKYFEQSDCQKDLLQSHNSSNLRKNDLTK